MQKGVVSTFALQPLYLPLEHESAHAYIEKYTNTDHRGNHRSAAIGEERKRDSHYREKADDHPHVDQHMPEEHGSDTHRQQSAETVIASAGYVQAPENQEQVKDQHKQAADKTPFFGKDGKCKIGMLFGKKPEMRLGAVQEPFSNYAA